MTRQVLLAQSNTSTFHRTNSDANRMTRQISKNALGSRMTRQVSLAQSSTCATTGMQHYNTDGTIKTSAAKNVSNKQYEGGRKHNS